MNIPFKSINGLFKLFRPRLALFIFLISIPFFSLAQLQELGIPFQGVAKDFSGQFVNERVIYIDLSIISKEAPSYLLFNELHQTKTDEWGVFSVLIGKGKTLGATFSKLSQLDWTKGNYELQIKMAITPDAPLNDWNYNQHFISLGSTPFGVVPYALYSLTAGTANSNLNDKLAIADTTQLLAPYVRKVASIDRVLLDSLLKFKVALKDSGLHYITPSQLNANLFDSSFISNRIEQRMKYSDTVYLSNRIDTKLHKTDTVFLSDRIDKKLNKEDTLFMSERIDLKLNKRDTSYLSNRVDEKLNKIDTIYLSNRINLMSLKSNKSNDINLLSDYNHQKYPSVKATKDYVDNQVSMGAADATINNRGILQLAGDLTGDATEPRIALNAVTTSKIVDASITDAKIASGIQASKVGLGNVSNHAQIYNLNGLIEQVQSFSIPGVAGLAPNWISVGANHTINIPMANGSSVTAGLISKTDYDHFNAAFTNNINTLTNSGNSGAASLTGQSLNVPNYSISGLSGIVNPNFILAGPINGAAGTVQYRALVANDIPNHAANTTGNAATASKLQTASLINNVLFDGSAAITINATTSADLIFNQSGSGASTGAAFNGSNTKTISYNTIGASPLAGSTSLVSVGTITAGTWAGNIIGSNYGGAGNVNGILKANGSGLISAASAVSDFQVPLTFSAPLNNDANTVAIAQSNTNTAGYLSSADWNSFNNKINATEKAAVNGVATLNALGKIPTSQIPAISFSSGYVVSSEAQMLALSAAVVGSIAIRTDNSKNYVLSATDPAVSGNWLELLMPAAVSSVNGYTTGSIVLTSSDIAEGTKLYFNNTRVRTAVDAFLTGDLPMNYNSSTGKIGITQSTTSSNGYLSATDWNTFNNKQNAFSSKTSNTFFAAPNGVDGTPIFRTILAADIPTLNQNTTGNAASSNILTNARTINGVDFDGSANIIIPSNTSNALTFNNSGTGAVSTTTFNGSAPITISYNSIGASPLAGSNSITSIGTITTGTWNANVLGSNYGGAGTISGILKADGNGVVSAAVANTDFESPLSFTAPLIRSSNTISAQTATTSNSGILSASDWQLFNSKQAALIAGVGVTLSGGNTMNIGQAVNTTSSPSFAGLTISGLNVSGLVANSAAGILSTIGVTGTGLVVKQNTPTLITPILGNASATSISTGTITATGSIVSNSDITAKRFKLTMPLATTAASTTGVDLSTGNVFTINLVANIATFNLTNPVVGTYLLKFVQDATGSRTVAFPVAWKWAGGIAPTLTLTASKLDIVTLIYDGTNYYATIVKNF